MIAPPRPLSAALLALLAGLLPTLRFAPDPLPPLLLAAAAALTALLLFRSRATRSESLLLLAFAAAGAALGAHRAAALRADCRAHLPDGARVHAEGALGAGVAAVPPGELPPALPLEGAQLSAGTARCRGAVRVRLPTTLPPSPAGTRLRVVGEWIASSPGVVPSRWPADPYFGGMLRVDTVIAAKPPSWRADPLLWWRGRVESSLRRLFGGQAPLAEALLLGRRERVAPEIRERFTRSGLVHLLAISGSHVALFASMVLVIGAAARLPRHRLAWLCIGVTAAYLAVIGAPASAVRAGLMLSLGLLALLLQRPTSPTAAVAAAALPILALDPAAALDPGFQLSFAGVLGILALRRPLLACVPARCVRTRSGRYLAEALAVGTGAWAATAPLVAFHFGQAAPIALVANLPAIPATGLALIGVVLAVALEPLAAPVARLVADGGGVALAALDAVAAWAAAVPLGHFPVARPDLAAWGAAAIIGCVAWAGSRSRLPPRTRAALAGACCAAVLLGWPGVRGRGTLDIHVLDVGQGDAVALRTPRGRWLLVDAGPRGPRYDAGARRVLPFLRASGARRLEALILTHPDLDHIGGAPAVLRGIHVARLVEPGLPVGKTMYREILALADSLRIPWLAARAGRSLTMDGVSLRFLWPDTVLLDDVAEANQISAVIRVDFAGVSLLLPGDVSESVERELVSRDAAALRAQILKAGHHGSATSTSAALLAAARPALVVISAGRRNRYGHPAPEVLRRLQGAGIDIARTDRDGTVTLRVAERAPGRWTLEVP